MFEQICYLSDDSNDRHFSARGGSFLVLPTMHISTVRLQQTDQSSTTRKELDLIKLGFGQRVPTIPPNSTYCTCLPTLLKDDG